MKSSLAKAVIALAFCTRLSHAAVSVLQDHATTTYDPVSNLEWLDASFTAGQSYNDVANGYGGFTTTEGYRFATRTEIFDLFQHAGGLSLFTPAGAAIPENLAAASQLLQFLGVTIVIPTSNLQWTTLLYDPASDNLGPFNVPAAVIEVGQMRLAPGIPVEGILGLGFGEDPARPYPEVASALVRVVPEPSSFALSFAAIFPLVCARSRSRRGR